MPSVVCALRGTGRVLGLVGTLLLAVGLPQSAIAQDAAQQPSSHEAGLFELRVARLAARTVVVQVDSTGRVLLPVDAALDLTGMPFERPHADSARRVPLVGGDRRAELDLRSGTLVVPGATEQLPAGAAAVIDGELYLHSEWLAKLLNAEVRVDFAALTATFTRVPPFPVEQQALAAQRRAARRQPGSLTGFGILRDAPYLKSTGGAVLDWNLSTVPDRISDNTSMYGQLGAAVYGGSLTLAGNWYTAGTADQLSGSWNYSYNEPRSPWVRQVQVGDLFGGGTQLRNLRGLSVTNARMIRDGLFSEVPVTPDVPSGWSYEVYQDGQLLGYSEAGATESVNVPLRYGSTPVRVRMIAPTGEEVTSEFRYQVHSTQLAPGILEYAAGVGGCRESSCGLTSFARLDWGATSRMTLSASAEWMETDSTRELHGALRALGAPARNWYATLDLVPRGRSQLLLMHDTYAGRNSSVGVGVIEPGSGIVSSVVGTRSRWFGEARHGRSIRDGIAGIRGVRADVHVEGFTGEHFDRLFGSVSVDGTNGTYAVRYERDPSLPAALMQLSHFTVLGRGGKGRLAYLPVALSAGVTRERVERLEASTTIRATRRGNLNFVGRWNARTGTTFSINFDALLGHSRVTMRGMATRGGQATLLTSAGGAAAYSRAAGAVFIDQSGSNLAGMGGRVFYDVDGDGVFGPSDEPATGLGVIAGGRRVRTDSAGRYRVWSILPYEVTAAAVDTLRDIDASFVPLHPEVALRPVPNLFNRADFPLVRTRELTGRLVAGPGIPAVGGVTVELINTGTADTLRTMTFSDGEFYVSRVRPGTYQLRLAPSSVAALRAIDPKPVHVVVAGTGPDLLVEVPPVEVRRGSVVEASQGTDPAPR